MKILFWTRHIQFKKSYCNVMFWIMFQLEPPKPCWSHQVERGYFCILKCWITVAFLPALRSKWRECLFYGYKVSKVDHSIRGKVDRTFVNILSYSNTNVTWAQWILLAGNSAAFSTSYSDWKKSSKFSITSLLLTYLWLVGSSYKGPIIRVVFPCPGCFIIWVVLKWQCTLPQNDTKLEFIQLPQLGNVVR